jgi:hypothetical protein
MLEAIAYRLHQYIVYRDVQRDFGVSRLVAFRYILAR